MERYVAIDNVCAWPNLTRMPNGDVIATIFNQPCHGRWEGDVECWASSDEGRTWEYRGTPAPHEPGTNRMNVAAGLAHNGDLIVIASGWSNKPKKGEAAAGRSFGKAEVLTAWICRSADRGETWERDGTVEIPNAASNPIPFGDIVRSPDGTLGVSVYDHKKPEKAGERTRSSSYFLRSRDDGRTWGEAVVIAAETYNETDLLCLDGNRWLAAVRTRDDAHLDIFASDDAGQSWILRGSLTGPRQHPAHLIKLSDGRIVVTYGIRHRGFYGVGARLSEDQGETWQTPIVLVDLDDAFDGGYPSSVELEDGSILTAYYASGVKAHTRYHMGVVRWKPEDQLALNAWK